MTSNKEIKTVDNFQLEITIAIKKLYHDMGFTPNDTAKAVFFYQTSFNLEKRAEEFYKQAYQSGQRDAAREIHSTMVDWAVRKYPSRKVLSETAKVIKSKYTPEPSTSFFDKPIEEKKQMVTEATQEGNRMQKEFMEDKDERTEP